MSRVLQGVAAGLLLFAGTVLAQGPAPAPQRRPSVLPPGTNVDALMQAMNQALGVECEYCHGVRGRGARGPLPANGADKPRMEVAREMVLMVADVNTRVQAATAKEPNEATRVQCATCHRGVPIPRQLADILTATAVKQGPDAVALQFNELRRQYYGKQAYDFSELYMIQLGERLTKLRAESAVALMQANVPFYPKSSMLHMILGMAQSQSRDYQGAIASFQKAVELDPNNNNARGRLAQLEGQVNRPLRP